MITSISVHRVTRVVVTIRGERKEGRWLNLEIFGTDSYGPVDKANPEKQLGDITLWHPEDAAFPSFSFPAEVQVEIRSDENADLENDSSAD